MANLFDSAKKALGKTIQNKLDKARKTPKQLGKAIGKKVVEKVVEKVTGKKAPARRVKVAGRAKRRTIRATSSGDLHAAAVRMGEAGRGKSKNFSTQEIARRTARLAQARKLRWR